MILRLKPLFALALLATAPVLRAQVMPVHVNYSLSDGDLFGTSFDHASYVLNSANDTSALGMLFAVCDTFPDRISGNFYSKDFLPAVRLDSLRIKISHTKVSTRPDSLFLSLANTFGGVFPGENGYYADTIVLGTSYAPGNTYATAKYLSIPVGIYVTNPFSVWLHRRSHPNDTLRVWSGYGYDGVCTEQPGLKKARESHFFPNAFAYRKEFGQVLPTLNGEDIFFECDTLPGFDSLADGRNYIQNWDIDFFMTVTTAGIPQNVLADSPLLYPNPGNGTFQMNETCQYLNVYTLSGQRVWGGVPQGASVCLPLPAGFYVVRAQTGTGTRIQKLIITE